MTTTYPGTVDANGAVMTTIHAQTDSEKLAIAREALAIASRVFKRLNANPAVGANDSRRVLHVLREAIVLIDGPRAGRELT